MNIPHEATILVVIASAIACLYYIDAKTQYRFIDWINGECKHPFNTKADLALEPSTELAQPAQNQPKDNEVAALKSRIATLEKIVTEPAYELNKKINQL